MNHSLFFRPLVLDLTIFLMFGLRKHYFFNEGLSVEFRHVKFEINIIMIHTILKDKLVIRPLTSHTLIVG